MPAAAHRPRADRAHLDDHARRLARRERGDRAGDAAGRAGRCSSRSPTVVRPSVSAASAAFGPPPTASGSASRDGRGQRTGAASRSSRAGSDVSAEAKAGTRGFSPCGRMVRGGSAYSAASSHHQAGCPPTEQLELDAVGHQRGDRAVGERRAVAGDAGHQLGAVAERPQHGRAASPPARPRRRARRRRTRRRRRPRSAPGRHRGRRAPPRPCAAARAPRRIAAALSAAARDRAPSPPQTSARPAGSAPGTTWTTLSESSAARSAAMMTLALLGSTTTSSAGTSWMPASSS